MRNTNPATLRTLLFVALLASNCSAWGASDAGAASPPTSTASAASTTSSNEVVLLRAQLADAHRFQEQVLSTVYWSLGTVGGVALLLVGFGWFTNFRVYERDRLALERDLRTQLAEELLKAKSEANQVATFRFAEQDKSLAAAVASVETRFTSSASALVANAVQEFNLKHADLAKSASHLRREVRELQLASEIRTHREDRENGDLRNALQASVTALELANQVGSDYSVGEVLDLITKDIADILNSTERPIDNFLVGQLVTALDAVKGQHAHAAAALKSQGSKLLSA